MGTATQEQLNNPLHGVKLAQILEYLEANLGWEEMGRITNINCFKNRPTMTSSLRFLRKTDWAREKVTQLYLDQLEPELDPSVNELWVALIAAKPEYAEKGYYDAFHFSDNKKEANEALAKVLAKTKCASLASLLWFKQNDEDLPEVGNIYIICDWEGTAQAAIESTSVEQIPFSELSEKHANLEGESELNQEEWKAKQWEFFKTEMEEFNKEASEEMPLILEQFQLIWPAQ